MKRTYSVNHTQNNSRKEANDKNTQNNKKKKETPTKKKNPTQKKMYIYKTNKKNLIFVVYFLFLCIIIVLHNNQYLDSNMLCGKKKMKNKNNPGKSIGSRHRLINMSPSF